MPFKELVLPRRVVPLALLAVVTTGALAAEVGGTGERAATRWQGLRLLALSPTAQTVVVQGPDGALVVVRQAEVFWKGGPVLTAVLSDRAEAQDPLPESEPDAPRRPRARYWIFPAGAGEAESRVVRIDRDAPRPPARAAPTTGIAAPSAPVGEPPGEGRP